MRKRTPSPMGTSVILMQRVQSPYKLEELNFGVLPGPLEEGQRFYDEVEAFPGDRADASGGFIVR